MKRIARVICLVCVTALMFTLMLGCQQKDTAGDNDQSTSEIQQTAEVPQDVSLRFSWWGGDARHKAYLEVVDLYENRNPHVTIEAEYSSYDGYHEKLITQLAGKTAPDVFAVAYELLPDYARQGVEFLDLYTMTDVVDINVVDKKFLDQYFVMNGKLQALPGAFAGLGLLINEDFFKKFNIPLDFKWTWDNLLEEGKKVHEQDPKCYLFNGNLNAVISHVIPLYLNQLTGDFWIKDDFTCSFTKEQLVDMFIYLRKLIDYGVMQPFEETSMFSYLQNDNPKWMNGQELGMMLQMSAVAPFSIEGVTWKAGASIPPVFENAKDTAIHVDPSGGVAVCKDSKYPKEAAKFLNFFINDLDAVVVRKDTWGTPTNAAGRQALVDAGVLNPLSTAMVQIALDNQGMGQSLLQYNAEIATLVTEATEKMAYKKLTPDKVAEELFTKLNSKLEELKKAAK